MAQDFMQNSEIREDYARLAEEAEGNLERHVLGQWFPRAVDPSGGFHQNYAEDWAILPESDRSVVCQSRLIWLASQAARRYPEQAESYLAFARHGFSFLQQKLWDSEIGGFYWSRDKTGEPEREGEKHVYGLSFAIYAMAAFYHASRDETALNLAKQAYAWLQEQAYDAVNGGWHEAQTRQGVSILGPTADGSKGAVITQYGFKSMNTHIHLLESLTSLYEVWPDPALRRSLTEAFEIVRDKVAVEAVGCLNLFFTSDWRALPDHDSFGHDVETAFLMVEAISALGQGDDSRTWALARRIVDHALDYGWDTKYGGFYDAGSVFGRAYNHEKIWWVQAEGLNALLLMHQHFGTETDRYWAAFQEQWAFIQVYQIDAQYGGWYSEVGRDGTPKPGRVKSDRWTEGYHQGRALLTVSAGLRQLAGGARFGAGGGA